MAGGRTACSRPGTVPAGSLRSVSPLSTPATTPTLPANLPASPVLTRATTPLTLVDSALPYGPTNAVTTWDRCGLPTPLVNWMTRRPRIPRSARQPRFFRHRRLFHPCITCHRAPARRQLRVDQRLHVARRRMVRRSPVTAGPVVLVDLTDLLDVDIPFIADTGVSYRSDRCSTTTVRVCHPPRPSGPLRACAIATCSISPIAPTNDSGNSIVLQAVRYPELWRNDGGFDTDGVLWSWTIDLPTGTVAERQLDDRAVEFPRIDDRLAGLPARYAVSVGMGELVRYDLCSRHRLRPRVRPGESAGPPGPGLFLASADRPAGRGPHRSAGW